MPCPAMYTVGKAVRIFGDSAPITALEVAAKPLGSIPVEIYKEGALYKSHGSGRLLTQSTIVVFWLSWYRPAF